MSARCVIGRAAAVGTALVMAFSTPATAAAAQGTFWVNNVPILMEPLDYACYPVDWAKNNQLRNETNRRAHVYNRRGCAERDLVLVLDLNQAQSLPYSADGSVKFIPK
ncbi:hypothetical protein [Saccharopolyspora taberi]|uniref:Uncharacterized protein n=1 Tax=Saccharopolyspora taberi TaxID=60895 RepID=A0ABN3V6Y9_9PSEU